jgi:hypothetical protein
MAIACLRLFTVPPFPPFPDFRVPRFNTLAGGFAVSAPTGSASRTGCHFSLLLVRMWARTGLSVAQQRKKRFSRIVHSRYGILVGWRWKCA